MADTCFATAKTMTYFADTNLKLIKKIRATQTPNFVISSQDFHNEFVKSVTDFKYS